MLMKGTLFLRYLRPEWSNNHDNHRQHRSTFRSLNKHIDTLRYRSESGASKVQTHAVNRPQTQHPVVKPLWSHTLINFADYSTLATANCELTSRQYDCETHTIAQRRVTATCQPISDRLGLINWRNSTASARNSTGEVPKQQSTSLPFHTSVITL